MSAISIISCVVGIIGCLIGVATFVSAQITKAKQDGVLIAKVDQCVKNTEEIRKDVKEKNREFDSIIDEHSKAIVELQTNVKSIFKQLNMDKK